jgi:hypothetical protein
LLSPTILPVDQITEVRVRTLLLPLTNPGPDQAIQFQRSSFLEATMRPTTLTAAALLAAALLAGCTTAAAEPTDTDTDPATAHALEHPGNGGAELAEQLATLRAATAPYATDLEAAKHDGFFLITQHLPGMGSHFLNPAVEGFDVGNPPILVYVQDPHGEGINLVAVEWVFPEEPKEPPLEGATYGSFAAACHYADGTFEAQPSEAKCAPASPESGAAFTFWHPDLVTLHVWLWHHNPDGLYASTNPLITPYDSAAARPPVSAHGPH